MWIFCCGMQRSGSTLQFQLTAGLVEEAGRGKRVEWVKPHRFKKLREKYAEDQSWKVFKSHVCAKHIAREFYLDNARGVYVYRDLRDVFVSAMRKYATTFELLWNAPFLDECLENYHKWTALPHMLISRYEGMITALPAEVARIARHLGLEITPQRCEQIAAEYSIAKQLDRIDEAKRDGRLKHGVAKETLYDPRTNLHTNHIQSGGRGEWKKFLSQQQVELIEGKAGDWLAAHGYELARQIL